MNADTQKANSIENRWIDIDNNVEYKYVWYLKINVSEAYVAG